MPPLHRSPHEQKAENRALSQVGNLIENAIGGMRRYNILADRLRNRRANFQGDFIAIYAGLRNFSLAY